MAKTVLIVEDYADVRAMMKFLVRRYGYEVVEAADGYEAVKKAKQYHPDLILMDLAMPLMDGLTAALIIRNSEGFEDIPVVALSAYGHSNYKSAMDAGFVEVINKPLDFGTFESFLKKYLEH